MSFQDIFIRGRNTLINQLIGVNASTILNPRLPDSRIFSDGVELSAEIKKTANKISSIAIDSDQNLVDFTIISESEVYKQYCTLVRQLHYLEMKDIDSIPEQLAFWINLYNSLTIDAVIQFEIEKSVTEGLIGFLSFFERAAYKIGVHRISLTDIEHGILRANRGFPYFIGPHFHLKDPRREWVLPILDHRIHFALNCVSNSCPPIGFYNPVDVQSQLDLASCNFVDRSVIVDFDRELLSLSSIFRWYLADFRGHAGVLDFIQTHLSNGDKKEWIFENRESIRIIHQCYDWTLNSV